MSDSTDFLKEHLYTLRQTARRLLHKAACSGGVLNLPLIEQHSLGETCNGIAGCKAELRARGVAVDDQPEDAAPPASGPLPVRGVSHLRAPVADFVGRAAELAQVVAALQPDQAGRAAAISGVRGMGGLGKTELAYAAAAQLAPGYPDGQVLLELGGASATPLSPAQALQQVIRAFRPEEQLPEELEALKQLYRTTLAGRRVLILADDARDATQVRLLLPPVGSALLVTSRQRLVLDGMRVVDLGRLDKAAAVALLRGICARLTEAQAGEIARLCGYLPLALRASAGILLNDTALTPERYIAQLAQQPLAALHDPDDPARDVGAILLLSYAALDRPEQQAFRRLGVLGADADLELVASVLGLSQAEANTALRSLLRRSLVEYDEVRERWGMHDLVRACARDRLVETGGISQLHPPGLIGRLRQLLGSVPSPTREDRALWLRYAKLVIALIRQANWRYLDGGAGVLEGLALFDRERSHLEAVRAWLWSQPPAADIDALLISEAGATVYISALREPLRAVRVPQLERALAAARRQKDRSMEGIFLGNLGLAHADLGEVRRALTFYEQVLAIARELGDRRGEGMTLGNLGNVYRNLGQVQRALTFYEQALAIARELSERRGESDALCNLGGVYSNLGEIQKALTFYEQALAIARELGDRRGEGQVLCNLGNAYHSLGEVQRALTCQEQALAIARELGDRRGEGQALGNLGNAYADLGEVQQAITFYEQGLAIARELGDRRGEGITLGNLGNAYADLGEVQQAITFYGQRLAIARELGDRRGEGITLGNLGFAWETLEDYAQAHRFYGEQLRIHQEIGDKRGEALALDNLGTTFLLLGDAIQARSHCEAALVLARNLGDRSLEGTALRDLANALAALGLPAEADACYVQSLAIHDELDYQSGATRTRWDYGRFLLGQGQRERGLPLMAACVAYEQRIGHAQAEEHAAELERLRGEGAA